MTVGIRGGGSNPQVPRFIGLQFELHNQETSVRTALGKLKAGSRVNLEPDLITKCLERLTLTRMGGQHVVSR